MTNTLQIGLPVVYIDANGNQFHATISALYTGTTNADLLVFVSEAGAYRNDQTNVPQASGTVTVNCWNYLA
jgi:hypothetical protein